MIFNALYAILFKILEWLLPLLPDVTWSVDSGAISYFIGILESLFYLLPMGTVGAILGIIISLTTFRILIALLRTVMDIIPFV